MGTEGWAGLPSVLDALDAAIADREAKLVELRSCREVLARMLPPPNGAAEPVHNGHAVKTKAVRAQRQAAEPAQTGKKPKRGALIEAVERILRESQKPMAPLDVFRELKAAGIATTAGSVAATLANQEKRGRFAKAALGLYAMPGAKVSAPKKAATKRIEEPAAAEPPRTVPPIKKGDPFSGVDPKKVLNVLKHRVVEIGTDRFECRLCARIFKTTGGFVAVECEER